MVMLCFAASTWRLYASLLLFLTPPILTSPRFKCKREREREKKKKREREREKKKRERETERETERERETIHRLLKERVTHFTGVGHNRLSTPFLCPFRPACRTLAALPCWRTLALSPNSPLPLALPPPFTCHFWPPKLCPLCCPPILFTWVICTSQPLHPRT